MIALRWIMSLIFIVQMYAAMVPIGLAYLPAAIVDRELPTLIAGGCGCRFGFCADFGTKSAVRRPRPKR